MADSATRNRVEPTLGTTPSAPSVEELRAAVESVPPAPPPAPATSNAEPPTRAGIDQLSRIEDKAARIEEKYARTETLIQRLQDKVEAATGRMSEAALQSDLVIVRERVDELTRRVRRLPGLNSLVFTAIVTALLTAALTVAAIKYLPGILPGISPPPLR
jgi:polyhydroxyalkanoate synthesis regulator phasin